MKKFDCCLIKRESGEVRILKHEVLRCKSLDIATEKFSNWMKNTFPKSFLKDKEYLIEEIDSSDTSIQVDREYL